MILNRIVKRLPQGDNQETILVRLESQDCPQSGLEGRFVRSSVLRQLADHPELSDCEGNEFQTVTISYSGKAWVVEAKATVQKPIPRIV